MKTKMIITTLLFLIAALIFYSCDTTEPGGDKPKPPGYQKDIPWPSLADSPWPMYRADPQKTGRSKFMGATGGSIAWSSENYLVRSCVIGEDGSIYFIAAGDSAGFYALNSDGSLKWKIPLEISPWFEDLHTPILSSDGIIYFTDPQTKQFYAIDTSGTIKWKIDNLYTDDKLNALILDKTGNIFFLGLKDFKTNLYYVSKEGEILWNIENSDFTDGMSFSPDGNTLYVAGSTQSGTAFYALDLNGTIKWEFKAKKRLNYCAPLIDNNGNCYVVASRSNEFSLFSINPEGQILWAIPLSNEFRSSNEVALDKEGNLYLGFYKLLSIKVDGTINWEMELDDQFVILSPISINGNNEIYFTVGSEYGDRELWKIDKNGKLIWKTFIGGTFYPNSSLIIGYNEVMLTEISLYFFKIIR